MTEEMKRLKALRKGEHYVFNPEDQLRGSLRDSPDDSEAKAEDGGRDNAAAPGTGAGAGAGQLLLLGGLEEEVGGGDAAGQGGIGEERGDSTEEEELPSSKWKEKATREWWALQEKLDPKWLEEQREAAAQEQRRSSR